MLCTKCGQTIPEGEEYRFQEQVLCEDCYLDYVSQPKTCDPWAVYTAKNMNQSQQELTDIQRNILDTLQNKGPLTFEQLCSELNMESTEVQRNFASLRHMELTRGFNKNGVVYLTLFSDRENVTSN